jgi:hypothetical protein
MEAQEKALLSRQVLADLLLDASGGDAAMLAAVERFRCGWGRRRWKAG